jgi:valyl-tRNA synthetase
VLLHVLCGILKLLHPFMPFITEEIYGSLPNPDESIMISAFPAEIPRSSLKKTRRISRGSSTPSGQSASAATKMNVPPSRKAKVYIATKFAASFGAGTAAFFTRLASASDVIIAEEHKFCAGSTVQIITDSSTIYLPMSDIVDTEKEKSRLEGEK